MQYNRTRILDDNLKSVASTGGAKARPPWAAGRAPTVQQRREGRGRCVRRVAGRCTEDGGEDAGEDLTKFRTFIRFESSERSDSGCNFYFRNRQIPPLSLFGKQVFYFIFCRRVISFSFRARVHELVVLFSLAHNLHKLSYTT